MKQALNVGLTPLVGDTSLAELCVDLMQDLLRFRVDIENALSYDMHSHSFDDVVTDVLNGQLLFYPLENSFVMMSVIDNPKSREYHGFLAGGKLEELLAFEPTLVEHAKALNCNRIGMVGRSGWVPALRRIGYDHTCAVLIKEI